MTHPWCAETAHYGRFDPVLPHRRSVPAPTRERQPGCDSLPRTHGAPNHPRDSREPSECDGLRAARPRSLQWQSRDQRSRPAVAAD